MGFWPWPRVWLSDSSVELSEQLERTASKVHLAEPLAEQQAAVFREVARSFVGSEFEAHICADGLLAYRHFAHEEKIKEGWEQAKDDITIGLPASAEAWPFYVSALNILFMLLESELHSGGRNSYIYWIPIVTRTDIVRVRYDDQGKAFSTTWHGPETEMGLQRYGGATAVGARIDGHFHGEILDAFEASMSHLEAAHSDEELWAFLSSYSASWSSLHNGLRVAALADIWVLVERRLVELMAGLLASVPSGVLSRDSSGTVKPLSAKAEKHLRAQIARGESPMAGRMIGVLEGHGVSLWPELPTVKAARDRLAHGAAPPTFSEVRDGLLLGRSIGRERFGLEIRAKLEGNPHLGLTP